MILSHTCTIILGRRKEEAEGNVSDVGEFFVVGDVVVTFSSTSVAAVVFFFLKLLKCLNGEMDLDLVSSDELFELCLLRELKKITIQ